VHMAVADRPGCWSLAPRQLEIAVPKTL
jgi:hypothetical protein